MKFIDEAPVTLASGKGGAGCVSFRREKYVPRGGPDGGDGGKGGDVIFKVDTRLHSLLDFKYKNKYAAANGEPGGGSNCTGADGEDLVLLVPPGTILKDTDGRILLDLGNDGEYVLLRGGRGGKGNTFFANSVNQAPMTSQPGEPGTTKDVILELKLIADIGIVGYPNAGKSTLISRLSEARPKIADYPFTTLVPNLGVVRLGDNRSFVIADMPGLIPGAHKGVGLGTRFLKHIERTKAFIHLVDASGISGRDPVKDYDDIFEELKMYDKAHKSDPEYRTLCDRPQIVVLNKADTISLEQQQLLAQQFQNKGLRTLTISAVTGQGLQNLLKTLGEIIFG